MHNLRRIHGWLALPLLLAAGLGNLPAQTQRDKAQWEPEIKAFEAGDRTNPPPKHAVLFVGSSSIRLWKTLAKDFPGQQVINRGFGGSRVADSTAFAERIIFPYEPRLIVFYAGENDLAEGETPEGVTADFRAFLGKIQAKLPDTHIAFISVKPSPLRWSLKEKMDSVNRQIAAMMKGDKLAFIDIRAAMLGEDGKPKPEIFVADHLHMNAKGYALWVPVVKPFLEPGGPDSSKAH